MFSILLEDPVKFEIWSKYGDVSAKVRKSCTAYDSVLLNFENRINIECFMEKEQANAAELKEILLQNGNK